MYLSPRKRFILCVTCSYLVFGSAWIFLSDRLLMAFTDIAAITRLSTAKGIAFIIFTALLLILALIAIPDRETVQSQRGRYRTSRFLVLADQLPRWIAYVLAVAVTLAMLLVRMNIAVAFGDRPLLILFMLPIILSSVLGGFGPGLAATAIASLGIDYYGIPPLHSLRIGESHDLFQWVMLITSGILSSYLSELLHRARRHSEEQRICQEIAQEELRQSEVKHRLLFESANDAIFIHNLKEQILAANPLAVERLGYTHSELMSMTVNQLASADEGFIIHEWTERLKAQGHLTFETAHQCKDGSLIPTEISARQIEWEGQPAVMSICRDITERKRAEETLAEESTRRRILFEQSPDGIVIIDPQTKLFIDFNTAAHQQLDYSREEFTQLSLFDLEAMETAEETKARVAAVIREGKADFETVQHTRQGKARNVHVTAQIVDVQGQPIYHCIWRDITERKRAEEALLESEKKLQVIFKRSPVGIILLDCQGVVLDCNQHFANIFDVQREEYLGMNLLDKMRKGPVRQNLVDAISNEKINYYEGPYTSVVNGKQFFINISSEKIAPDLIIAIIMDFTDRKRAEEEKAKLEIQLIQAQKMEAIGSLAGGIAHDLNNILFPISGLSEMLLNEIPPDNLAHASLDQIYKSAQRGSDLVKQILAFSRQSNPRKLPIRVQPILKEVLKLTRATIPMNLEITSNIDEDCSMISADPTQMHQVALNLIMNAYHAVEQPGGIIHVELKETIFEKNELYDNSMKSGKCACITISDTGTGIDQTLIDKIFTPYFTTKELGKGTGLGLSVVHGIVKEHGGDIQVNSEVGKGTVFRVYLPLLEDANDSKAAAVIRIHPTGCERILIVDDEEPIVRMEQMMLEKNGYQVTACTSSIDALAAFKASSSSFDLVISDRGMPNMTGEQLAAELISIRPGIPIILCTGFCEEKDMLRAKSMGVTEFLMKPVATGDLATMVRKVLDEATDVTQG